ncbi:MAG: T9SS type A sorting domain-containing protein [Ferruginibacter sp.]|nr:T9SS type A sorting domain-containing protein [Ferruginibacter sp.]
MFISVFIFYTQTIFSQSVTIDASPAGRMQPIDGFGTCLYGESAAEAWFVPLYYDDAMCSIVRMDLVPQFISPYGDFNVNSPWFHNSPSLPGPDNNNVRTYTGVGDYTRTFTDRKAQIAIMEPDINKNISKFNYDFGQTKMGVLMAKAGEARKGKLGDFKFTASIWSPAPWLKVSSGNKIDGQSGILPVNGTPWPFIWGGNYAGGKLDVSNTPRSEFFDGVENTSALTQFARSTAAYVKGIQDRAGVKFYAISIQNELNFEVFYNSCTYPLSSQYITALKVIRKEFDKYEDLKNIRLIGPEDLMGGAYAMWQYGGGDGVVHKNLQYLTEIAKDPVAQAAIDFYCIHGYASDGVSSNGADPVSWDWWANGWKESIAPGIPANIKGFRNYNKKSWMTETSGEKKEWIFPVTGFPNDGAFSIALKIQQALTTGFQSGWVYWQFGDGGDVNESSLTGGNVTDKSPKYVAFKHFSKYIRPNSIRLNSTLINGDNISTSAYIHDVNKTLTIVIVNSNSVEKTVTVNIPTLSFNLSSLESYTSGNNNYWQSKPLTVANQKVSTTIPGYGVSTLYGKAPIAAAIQDSPPEFRLKIKAFPNPFTHELSVILNSNTITKVNFKVTDMKGVSVYNSDKFSTNQIVHLGKELISGTYLVTATTEDGFQERVKIEKQ